MRVRVVLNQPQLTPHSVKVTITECGMLDLSRVDLDFVFEARVERDEVFRRYTLTWEAASLREAEGIAGTFHFLRGLRGKRR